MAFLSFMERMSPSGFTRATLEQQERQLGELRLIREALQSNVNAVSDKDKDYFKERLDAIEKLLSESRFKDANERIREYNDEAQSLGASQGRVIQVVPTLSWLEMPPKDLGALRRVIREFRRAAASEVTPEAAGRVNGMVRSVEAGAGLPLSRDLEPARRVSPVISTSGVPSRGTSGIENPFRGGSEELRAAKDYAMAPGAELATMSSFFLRMVRGLFGGLFGSASFGMKGLEGAVGALGGQSRTQSSSEVSERVEGKVDDVLDEQRRQSDDKTREAEAVEGGLAKIGSGLTHESKALQDALDTIGKSLRERSFAKLDALVELVSDAVDRGYRQQVLVELARINATLSALGQVYLTDVVSRVPSLRNEIPNIVSNAYTSAPRVDLGAGPSAGGTVIPVEPVVTGASSGGGGVVPPTLGGEYVDYEEEVSQASPVEGENVTTQNGEQQDYAELMRRWVEGDELTEDELRTLQRSGVLSSEQQRLLNEQIRQAQQSGASRGRKQSSHAGRDIWNSIRRAWGSSESRTARGMATAPGAELFMLADLARRFGWGVIRGGFGLGKAFFQNTRIGRSLGSAIGATVKAPFRAIGYAGKNWIWNPFKEGLTDMASTAWGGVKSAASKVSTAWGGAKSLLKGGVNTLLGREVSEEDAERVEELEDLLTPEAGESVQGALPGPEAQAGQIGQASPTGGIAQGVVGALPLTQPVQEEQSTQALSAPAVQALPAPTAQGGYDVTSGTFVHKSDDAAEKVGELEEQLKKEDTEDDEEQERQHDETIKELKEARKGNDFIGTIMTGIMGILSNPAVLLGGLGAILAAGLVASKDFREMLFGAFKSSLKWFWDDLLGNAFNSLGRVIHDAILGKPEEYSKEGMWRSTSASQVQEVFGTDTEQLGEMFAGSPSYEKSTATARTIGAIAGGAAGIYFGGGIGGVIGASAGAALGAWLSGNSSGEKAYKDFIKGAQKDGMSEEDAKLYWKIFNSFISAVEGCDNSNYLSLLKGSRDINVGNFVFPKALGEAFLKTQGWRLVKENGKTIIRDSEGNEVGENYAAAAMRASLYANLGRVSFEPNGDNTRLVIGVPNGLTKIAYDLDTKKASGGRWRRGNPISNISVERDEAYEATMVSKASEAESEVGGAEGGADVTTGGVGASTAPLSSVSEDKSSASSFTTPWSDVSAPSVTLTPEAPKSASTGGVSSVPTSVDIPYEADAPSEGAVASSSTGLQGGSYEDKYIADFMGLTEGDDAYFRQEPLKPSQFVIGHGIDTTSDNLRDVKYLASEFAKAKKSGGLSRNSSGQVGYWGYRVDDNIREAIFWSAFNEYKRNLIRTVTPENWRRLNLDQRAAMMDIYWQRPANVTKAFAEAVINRDFASKNFSKGFTKLEQFTKRNNQRMWRLGSTDIPWNGAGEPALASGGSFGGDMGTVTGDGYVDIVSGPASFGGAFSSLWGRASAAEEAGGEPATSEGGADVSMSTVSEGAAKTEEARRLMGMPEPAVAEYTGGEMAEVTVTAPRRYKPEELTGGRGGDVNNNTTNNENNYNSQTVVNNVYVNKGAAGNVGRGFAGA